VYAREMIERPSADVGTRPYGYRLYPIDAVACRVGSAMSGPDGKPLVFEGWFGGLSPTRRFARVVAGDDSGAARRIVDFDSAIATPNPSTLWAQWTANDGLIWTDRLDGAVRLFTLTPGGAPRAVREWEDAEVGLQISPDGGAVFVSVIPSPGPHPVDPSRPRPPTSLFESEVPRGRAPEELVYLPVEDRFLSLGAPFSDRASDRRYTEWAAPRTLARIGVGIVALESIDTPGVRRFAIGRPSDLE
jgi:hypothetical protein